MIEYRKGTKILGQIYHKDNIKPSTTDCEVKPSSFVVPSSDPIIELVYHSSPSWVGLAGSIHIEVICGVKRTGSQKDVFDISVPKSFKLLDGQYVLQLNEKFVYYKTETITDDGNGNFVFRFFMSTPFFVLWIYIYVYICVCVFYFILS